MKRKSNQNKQKQNYKESKEIEQDKADCTVVNTFKSDSKI